MPVFQPNVPTGSVPLDQDYLNLQGNNQQLDIAYGVDHVAFSDTSGIPPGGISGMHKTMHMVPVSTTASNPPNNQPINGYTATAGFGQLLSAQINDGINTDTALYWLTGANRLIQLTRNFVPVSSNNGYTMLPGGLIMQWGFDTTVTSSSGSTITYPIPFPNAVFNVSATVQTDDNTTIRFSILNNPTLTQFTTSQTSSSHFKRLYWVAIGN